MKSLYLNPGDWYFGHGTAVAQTILGSCVSILLWHPTRQLCGVCHCVLPSRSNSDTEQPAGFYVDETLHWLLAQMRQQQTHPKHYRAWLFGGGTMFASSPSDEALTARIAIGALNVAAAQQGLAMYGIPLLGQDCGQAVYRKLWVELTSGEWRLDKHTSRFVLSAANAAQPASYRRK